MRAGKQGDLWTRHLSARLIILSLLCSWIVGCVGTPTPPSVPSPTIPVEATLPSGWETYTTEEQCGYSISYPQDMDGASQGVYSWILSSSNADPAGPVRNFIYVSVIPDSFQTREIIYNYDPTELETLFNLQVGESISLREDPNTGAWFTYTRLLDTVLDNRAALTYENTQPWEFPLGTKEIRYYLQANGCTYIVGGYLATVGSGEPGAISQELFEQIIPTFRLSP